MEEHAVVTCFLRHGTEVLLIRRSDAVGSYRGKWGAVSGYAEGTPGEAARWEIDEEAGLLDATTFVRSADPLAVEDDSRGTRWLVYPFLFDCASTEVEPNEEIADLEWVQPPAILERETVPRLWDTYLAVAPSVETVRTDTDHGASYVSLRALEALRDFAAETAATGGTYEDVAARARALREARPSMGVIRTRIDHAMSSANLASGAVAPESIGAVRDAAIDACARAVEADSRAAEAAAETLGDRVLTLSRSGTVLEALRKADPKTGFVAESRPEREGVGVAEELAESGIDVTLLVDAAVGYAIGNENVDTVLVGADSVLADGTVLNKTGTRLAALAAEADGIDCYAVCSRDKVLPESRANPEMGPSEAVYDGDSAVSVLNPTFEAVPGDRFTGVITETGVLSVAELEAVAAEHAEYSRWDEMV